MKNGKNAKDVLTDKPMHINEIAKRAGKPVFDAVTELVLLALTGGGVKEGPVNCWKKKKREKK